MVSGKLGKVDLPGIFYAFTHRGIPEVRTPGLYE